MHGDGEIPCRFNLIIIFRYLRTLIIGLISLIMSMIMLPLKKRKKASFIFCNVTQLYYYTI